MRLEQFEFVMEVANQKSMVKASENLHMSTQNISKGIKQLEDELGVQIFTRNKYGVFLTTEGEHVLDEAIRILYSVNSLKDRFIDGAVREKTAEVEHINVLSAHATSVFASNLMERLCVKYRPESAAIIVNDAIVINERMKSELETLFNDHDLIFTNILQSELLNMRSSFRKDNMYSLRKDKLGVRVHRDSEFAKMESIAIKDIINQPLIMASPDKHSFSHLQVAIESTGVILKPKYYVNTPEATIRYISNGFGYSIVTYSKDEENDLMVSKGDTVIVPLKENIFVTHILAINPNFYDSRAFAKTFDMIKAGFPNMKNLF